MDVPNVGGEELNEAANGIVAVVRDDLRDRKAASAGQIPARLTFYKIFRHCSTRSSDYIQMYRGNQATLIESMERIQKTATRIIEAVGQAQATGEGGQRHVA